MVLNQSFLGKRPKSFNPVDVDLSLLELIAMLDVEMRVATEHERIISPLLVCVYDGASPHPLHHLGHKTLGGDILNKTHRDPPSPFQDPLDDGLASCTSSRRSRLYLLQVLLSECRLSWQVLQLEPCEVYHMVAIWFCNSD